MATTFSAAMRAPARELAIRGTLTFPSGAQRALTGQEMFFTSDIPADMTALLEKWRKIKTEEV